MFDKEGEMLRWNRRFEEVSGYSAEEMRRLHPLDFFPDYEKEGAAKAIERAFSAGEVSHEADILTKVGETLPFLLSGTRFDMDGEACVLGLGIDISERKRAERALAASEANLRAIFEHSQDAFMLIGRDFGIRAFNRAASERVSYTFNKTLKQGDSVLEFVFPQDQDAFYKASSDVLSGRKLVIERKIEPLAGEAYWAEIGYNPVRGDAGQVIGIVMNSRDISERKRYEAQIEYLAYHDSLTGLANRRLLHERAKGALALAECQGVEVALLYLDLDRFKIVNDTLGHDAGDALLVEVAAQLAASLRNAGTLARLGGDEFALLLTGSSRTQAAQVAKRVLAALAGPHDLGGRSLHIGGSIGIACYPGDGASLDELLKHADIAMYQAKADGSGFAFYEASKSPYSLERLELETALRQAVEAGELTLAYQPLLNLSQNAVSDYEALARWSRDGSLLVAEAFIPLAEESELIRRVDWLVLEKAISQALTWHQAGRELRLSVNLSARSLHYEDLLPYLSGLLSTTGLPAECLLLEITESAAMLQPEASRRTLAALKDLGVSLVIDDFGSGFASLTYLRQLPVDRVKIDRSLIGGIGHNRKDEHLVRAAIALGHGLELTVVAEGVETRAQLAWLKDHGCDLVQGHLIGEPEPASSLELYSS